MDFSQTFSPPSPTTLSYNSMSLEPPSGWSSKKKNNGVSSYTLHTQGFLFLVPLVRQTRFRYLHHLLVHRHNVVTNIVTTAAQIHNWGWPTRQSQERQKEKKAKNEDSRPPPTYCWLSGISFSNPLARKSGISIGVLGAHPHFKILWLRSPGHPHIKSRDTRRKKEKEYPWYWSFFQFWLLLFTYQSHQVVALYILPRVFSCHQWKR